jgi:hypothetical protein
MSEAYSVTAIPHDTIPTAASDEFLTTSASRIRELGQRAVDDVIEIGRILTQVRECVGSGNWLAWIKDEFDWGEDTAQAYIRIFDASESNTGTFQHLLATNASISAIDVLVRCGTPPEIVAEVVEEATKTGKAPTVRGVKRKVAAARSAAGRSTTKGKVVPRSGAVVVPAGYERNGHDVDAGTAAHNAALDRIADEPGPVIDVEPAKSTTPTKVGRLKEALDGFAEGYGEGLTVRRCSDGHPDRTKPNKLLVNFMVTIEIDRNDPEGGAAEWSRPTTGRQ